MVPPSQPQSQLCVSVLNTDWFSFPYTTCDGTKAFKTEQSLPLSKYQYAQRIKSFASGTFHSKNGEMHWNAI